MRSARAPRSSGSKLGDMARPCLAEHRLAHSMPMEAPRVRGVGDCTRLIPTLGDPCGTSGPRIDRLPSTRPPWWRRQYRELKNYFSAPASVPLISLDQYRTERILKQLHVTFESATAARPSRVVGAPRPRLDRRTHSRPTEAPRAPTLRRAPATGRGDLRGAAWPHLDIGPYPSSTTRTRPSLPSRAP